MFQRASAHSRLSWALNGLMAEVLEGHIRFHVLDPKSDKNAPQANAAEELIDVVRTYLKCPASGEHFTEKVTPS